MEDTSHRIMAPPLIAARLHQSGTVVINVLVDLNGLADDVAIGTSSGYSQLDAAALLDAQGWSFPVSGDVRQRTMAWRQVTVIFPPISNEAPVKADAWPDDALMVTGAKIPSDFVLPKRQSAPSIGGYPPVARRKGQQGSVTVEYVVGTDGWVENARIVKSSGYPLLDAEGLISCAFWEFSGPATKSGVPVQFRGIVNLIYKFSD